MRPSTSSEEEACWEEAATHARRWRGDARASWRPAPCTTAVGAHRLQCAPPAGAQGRKDGKQRQRQSVAFSATALYAAREACGLHQSRCDRTPANSARSFARLCGLTKRVERRVELVVKLSAHLPMPDQRRLQAREGTASQVPPRPRGRRRQGQRSRRRSHSSRSRSSQLVGRWHGAGLPADGSRAARRRPRCRRCRTVEGSAARIDGRSCKSSKRTPSRDASAARRRGDMRASSTPTSPSCSSSMPLTARGCASSPTSPRFTSSSRCSGSAGPRRARFHRRAAEL